MADPVAVLAFIRDVFALGDGFADTSDLWDGIWWRIDDEYAPVKVQVRRGGGHDRVVRGVAMTGGEEWFYLVIFPVLIPLCLWVANKTYGGPMPWDT